MKTIVYVLFISSLFLLSLPVQCMIAVSMIVTSGGPVLFRQKRIGKSGRPFIMYKFRTMRAGAENQQVHLRRRNEADGPVFKIHNDPRFTRVGRFLAHTGLDELPQLYNVLLGDMALFGPRPLPVAEAARLKGWQRKRHAIKPGIISPWIVNGYHAQSFDAWMKSDIAYIQKKSPWHDLVLAVRTMKLLARLLLREVAKT